MRNSKKILAKLRGIAAILWGSCLIAYGSTLAEGVCDTANFTSKKINYFLVASQAMYAGDVLPAAFEWDHKVMRDIITEVLLRRDEKDGRPLPASRQPQVL